MLLVYFIPHLATSATCAWQPKSRPPSSTERIRYRKMSQVVDAGRTGDQRRQLRGPGGCKWEPQLHAAAAPACTQLHSLQNSLQNLPRFLRLLVCACSQPGTGCAAWPFPIPFCYPYIDLIAAPASLICPKSTPLASIIAAFSNPSYTRSVGADPATPMWLESRHHPGQN